MVSKRGNVAQSQTLHDLNTVSIDARRELVLVEGQMSNKAPLIFTMHRRVLAALIGSLIQANGKFPKSKGLDGFPIQPLHLSGASAIAVDNGHRAVGLELVLGDGLFLQVIIPEGAMKPLRFCLDSLIALSDAPDGGKGNGSS
jgi:hypothetical protein